MIRIFKKINKTLTNNYGCIEITNLNELNKPIMLGISGQDIYDKAVFGIIREAAHAARVYTTQEMGAGFDINRMPVDFIGYTFEPDQKYKDNYEELAERFLIPLLKLRGINPHSIVKQARRINLFVFDNGATIYKKAEKKIYDSLIAEGIEKYYVEDILSQISVIVMGTKEDFSDVYATNIVFTDIRDTETLSPDIKDYGRLLLSKRLKSMYVPNGDHNSVFYPFIGTGIHSIKEYLKNESFAKPAISALVAFFLQNSVANMKTENILKITRDEMYEPLYYYGANLRPVDILLQQLDNEITYYSAVRYSREEACIRYELDGAYKCIQKNKLVIRNREQETKEVSDKLNNLVNSIRKYSSETTYYQILTDCNMWFQNQEVLKEKSDKEIRIEYMKENKKEKTQPKKEEATEEKKKTTTAKEKKKSTKPEEKKEKKTKKN